MSAQREVELLAIVADQAKTISRLAGELSELKARSDRISYLPNCNDCGANGKCPYMPKWGDMVRINCPHWQERKSVTEATK